MIEITSTNSNIVTIKVAGELQHNDFKKITAKVDSVIKKHKTINILMDATGFDGWESKQVAGEHFTFIKEYHHKVDRIALVSGHLWQQWLGGFANVFMHPKIKTFDADERKEAEKWLTEVSDKKEDCCDKATD